MKKYLVLFSFVSILFPPVISYAAVIDKTANIRVIGIIGEDDNNGMKEQQTPPIEEVSTIIKDTDKILPKSGGTISLISNILGVIFLFLGVFLYMDKCRVHRKLKKRYSKIEEVSRFTAGYHRTKVKKQL